MISRARKMINLAQNNVRGKGESKSISSMSYNREESVGNKEQISPANEKWSKFDNENSGNSDSLEAYPGSDCEYNTSNNSSAIEPFPGSCSEYNPSSNSSEAESNPEFSPITPKLKKKKLNPEFDTPPENFCKRHRRPSEWNKNIAKYLKNHGKDHYNKKGQFVPKKELKEGCKESCRMRCSQKLSKDTRTQISKIF